MAGVTDELIFERKDFIGSTEVYQTDDGRLFYCRIDDVEVHWNGQIFHSNMSEFKVDGKQMYACGFGVCGNAIYFAGRKEIYKAEFKCPRVVISYVRDMLEDERVLNNAIGIRYIQDKAYAYKLDQHPEQDAIEFDNRCSVFEIVGKSIFLRDCGKSTDDYWLSKSSRNTFTIRVCDRNETTGPRRVYSHSNSSCVYVTDGEHLSILRDGEITPVAFRGVYKIESIIGVHNGIITVVDGDHIYSARLKNLEGPRSPTEMILDGFHDMKMELNNVVECIEQNFDGLTRTIDAVPGEMEKQLTEMNETLSKIRLQGEETEDEGDKKN